MARKKRLKTTLGPRKLKQLIMEAGELCLEKKALDVVLLDLRKISQMTDYFLICTGYTDIHVRSVYEHIEEQLRERHDIKPWHVEGIENGRWVLMDYVDFVVHVFQPEARKFYQLEKLWIDAGRTELGSGEEDDEPEQTEA
jgi:ribosome-associated protein